MIGLIQRVDYCSVTVDNELVSSIGKGLLILLGVHKDDTEKDIAILARKCTGLRVFPDSQYKMNLSINDVGGEILVVSQFTLLGDVKGGLRPFFGDAAEPVKADDYYKKFMKVLSESVPIVKGGVFGAHMHLEIHNNGPVTIWIDTRELI